MIDSLMYLEESTSLKNNHSKLTRKSFMKLIHLNLAYVYIFLNIPFNC